MEERRRVAAKGIKHFNERVRISDTWADPKLNKRNNRQMKCKVCLYRATGPPQGGGETPGEATQGKRRS